MSNVLSVSAIKVTYAQTPVLNDVSFTLAQGDILGLLGASGCGKTTLLNTIAGFVIQQEGEVYIDGIGSSSKEHNIAPEHRHIGMIFQDYALFPHLTLEQNIAFGLKKMSKVQKKQKVLELLALLKLHDLQDHYPHQLSGGQQQRAAIARALAPEPRLLLLDEPFSNIDARLRHDLIHELRNVLKQLKMSAIFVTHNKDEVFAFADKVAVMHQGKIQQFGEPAYVCQHPASFHVADFLQLGSFLPVLAGKNTVVNTPLGEINVSNDTPFNSTAQQLVLVRAPFFALSKNVSGNATVQQVSVSEQGFKLRLKVSTDMHNFEVITFSEDEFYLGQKVQVSLLPHVATLLTK